jgi:hypothetical protein
LFMNEIMPWRCQAPAGRTIIPSEDNNPQQSLPIASSARDVPAAVPEDSGFCSLMSPVGYLLHLDVRNAHANNGKARTLLRPVRMIYPLLRPVPRTHIASAGPSSSLDLLRPTLARSNQRPWYAAKVAIKCHMYVPSPGEPSPARPARVGRHSVAAS